MGISVYPAPAAGKTLKVQRFTTPGLSTFTLPAGYGASNPLTAEILLVGAGGGAGRGHYNSGGDFGVGGGGGGGGVTSLTVQLTQNMNVMVGRGGASPNWYFYNGLNFGRGENGGCSYVSNSTPVNLMINPRFRGIFSAEPSISTPFGPGFSTKTTSYGNPGVGPTEALYDGSFSSKAYTNGPTFDVIAGTNYCFSMYYYGAGGSSTLTIALTWLQSDGTFISTTTATSQTVTSGAWVRRHVSGAAPANAAYCRIAIHRTGGTGEMAIIAPMIESGVTTPSTYVDGDTAGYRYTGSPAGSVTVSTSSTTFLASGGGGGAGLMQDRGYGVRGALGLPGASGGGAGWYEGSVASQWAMFGGHGGGAGGAAEPHMHIFDSDSGSTTYQASWQRRFYETSGRLSEYGEGTFGDYLSVISNFSQMYTGRPGPGVNGYGRGGQGSYASNTQSYSAWMSSVPEAIGSLSGVANTGNGGSSALVYLAGTTAVYGGAGGSGLVEIKYFD